MTLEEIAEAVRLLFPDPNPHFVRAVLSDALAEQGKTWREWLEESGTLERLAECMCLERTQWTWAYYEDEILECSEQHRAWRFAHGIPEPLADDAPPWDRLAEIFGLPPVRVEVGVPPRSVNRADEDLHWRPPCPALAHLVLLRVVPPVEFSQLSLGGAVADLHPEAVNYRLRLGDGDRWACATVLRLKRYVTLLREMSRGTPEQLRVLDLVGDGEAAQVERDGTLEEERIDSIAARAGCTPEFVRSVLSNWWKADQVFRRLGSLPLDERDA
jgi:hypothetical protein